MQMEADKLKEVAVDGTQMTIVPVGSVPKEGDPAVDFTEHYSIASVPLDGNVILIESPETLEIVQQRLLDASCSGQYSL